MVQVLPNRVVRVVRADGSETFVRPPGSTPQPRSGHRRDDSTGPERQAPTLQALRHAPPFNPDDPNQFWLREYNTFLLQILSYLVRQEELNAYLATENPGNSFDQFARRSELIDFLTQRR
jgi:hypothetical protein